MSEPLKEAGYDDIKYIPPTGTEKGTKIKLSRYPHNFWWNPPLNMKVKTKIGKRFLEIVEGILQKGNLLVQAL